MFQGGDIALQATCGGFDSLRFHHYCNIEMHDNLTDVIMTFVVLSLENERMGERLMARGCNPRPVKRHESSNLSPLTNFGRNVAKWLNATVVKPKRIGCEEISRFSCSWQKLVVRSSMTERIRGVRIPPFLPIQF